MIYHINFIENNSEIIFLKIDILDIEYIAGMDCGRPRGGRYPHRSYSIVVEYALCESERSAAIQLRYSCDSAAPRSIQIYSDSARLFVSAPFPCPFLRKV